MRRLTAAALCAAFVAFPVFVRPRQVAVAAVDRCAGQQAAIDANATLRVDGRPRTYLVHAPVRFGRLPLVFAFHGRGETPEQPALYSGLSALRAITVYPAGFPGRGGKLSWSGTPTAAPGVDDVRFAETTLDRLESTACVDRKRVHATAHRPHFVRASVAFAGALILLVDQTHMASPKRSNGWIGQVVVEVLVNIVAPFFVYTRFDASLGDVKALLLSSAPPICWSLFEFARSRRIDAVSLLVLGGIALSLVAFIGGGSVRWLQLRENLVTGLIGLIFLGSAIVRKPIIYQLARAGMARRSPSNVAAFEQLRNDERFRRSMSRMTLVWAFGLLAQTAVACILVFVMPISEYLIVGPIVSYVGFGALAAWTFWFAKHRRKAREATGSTSS